jgi:hypothetical protein
MFHFVPNGHAQICVGFVVVKQHAQRIDETANASVAANLATPGTISLPRNPRRQSVGSSIQVAVILRAACE